ncbi:MAG: efflux transporter outer membrane subunit [Planctomycetes bacterium]|jgi:multidrug efflux system outer membrane protein|nr:efflux transporter outer membrane subunit [Planctomycetota bacterium]
MTRPVILTVFTVALAAACTLGPDFDRPALDVPEAWRDLPVAETESLANTAWWNLYGDEELDRLIRIALEENQDLKIAVERIVEHRARVGYTGADLYPRVDVSAGGGLVGVSRRGVPELGDDPDRDGDLWGVSADLSWELDIFGRIRRATESEEALLLATEAARRATAILLVSDVASTYTRLREADAKLGISRRTLAQRKEYVELARRRFEGELTSEVDYRQAQAEQHRIEALVADLERTVQVLENELSRLLGRNPGVIARGRALGSFAEPPAVPAGLPSELLDRRPDLVAAEQRLHAATADVGAAKALLYPRFALTASYGQESNQFADLFEAPSRAWSLLGNVLAPIFNAGQNQARVEIAESQMRQELYSYERAVRTAFFEVENALVTYRKTGVQMSAEALRVATERQVLTLVADRYTGGVSSYLDVLDAQRSLFDAELEEVTTVASRRIALVQLYKALGGGWPTEAEGPSSPAAPAPAKP